MADKQPAAKPAATERPKIQPRPSAKADDAATALKEAREREEKMGAVATELKTAKEKKQLAKRKEEDEAKRAELASVRAAALSEASARKAKKRSAGSKKLIVNSSSEEDAAVSDKDGGSDGGGSAAGEKLKKASGKRAAKKPAAAAAAVKRKKVDSGSSGVILEEGAVELPVEEESWESRAEALRLAAENKLPVELPYVPLNLSRPENLLADAVRKLAPGERVFVLTQLPPGLPFPDDVTNKVIGQLTFSQDAISATMCGKRYILSPNPPSSCLVMGVDYNESARLLRRLPLGAQPLTATWVPDIEKHLPRPLSSITDSRYVEYNDAEIAADSRLSDEEATALYESNKYAKLPWTEYLDKIRPGWVSILPSKLRRVHNKDPNENGKGKGGKGTEQPPSNRIKASISRGNHVVVDDDDDGYDDNTAGEPNGNDDDAAEEDAKVTGTVDAHQADVSNEEDEEDEEVRDEDEEDEE